MSRTRGYLIAVIATALVAVSRSALSRWSGDEAPFNLFVLAVAAAAWQGGLRPGLLATALSTIVDTVFFLEPAQRLGVAAPTDGIRVLVFVAGGVLISWLFERVHGMRRQADRQKEELRVTLASIGDAVITTDPPGRVTSLNAVAAALTGWTEGDALGRPVEEIFAIVDEESRATVENPAMRALRDGSIVALANHTVLRARDGTECSIDDSAAPIRDGGGEIIGAVLVFRDVTRRRHADRAVRESEARKAGILATALDCIVTIDAGGRIVDFNPAAERTFGYARETAIGREMAELIVPPSLRDAHRAGLARYLATGQTVLLNRRLELIAIRADGTEFPIELSIAQIAGDGSPMFTGYIRDLTERREAEAALKAARADLEERVTARTREVTEANTFLEALLENVQVGIVACGPEGVLTLFNRVTREFHGLSEQPIPAEQWAERYDLYRADGTTPMDTEEVPLFRALRGERVRDVEMVIAPRRGERRTVMSSGQAIHDDAGTLLGAVVSMQDITARKRAEDAEHRAYAEMERRVDDRTVALREANRALEEEIAMRERVEQALRDADQRKNEFIATLAHELRNPLAPLRTALEILQRSGGRDPAAAGPLGVMERQLRHMVRIVDDLLDVSRIAQGKLEVRPEWMTLADLIESAIEASRPIIEARGHELVLDVPRETVKLYADLTRLSQALLNLLNNAAKYTERGGRIQLSARREADAVIVTVADNGAGIPASMLESVFDPFVQVDRSTDGLQGGLGIGLHLVRRLVEAHGGGVAAASEGPGTGARFTMRLPAMRAGGGAYSRSDSRAEPPSAAPATTGRLKVLVVDDYEDATRMLAMMLQQMGHDVHTAHDGFKAVEAAAAFLPDLVLLDIGLPGMDGYEAARRIRLQPRDSPLMLVALSGWGGADDRRRSKAAGFDLHLVKPLEPATLTDLLAGRLGWRQS